MPVLKQIRGSVMLSDGTPLTEYATKYKDGIVETYIVVPGTQQSFHVQITSEGYVAEGLGAFIYIDGKYQANRNRVDLKHPAYGVPSSSYEIDFRFRQKEERNGSESFVGRAWTFATLGSSAADNSQVWSESDAAHIGNIEVVILRCRSLDIIPASILSRSALPLKEISKHHNAQHVQNKKNRTQETHELPKENSGDIFGDGLLGIFDGTADESADEHGLITAPKDKPMYLQTMNLEPESERSISPGQHGRLLNHSSCSRMLDGTSDSYQLDWSQPRIHTPRNPQHQVQYTTRRINSNGRVQQYDPFWDSAPQDTHGVLGHSCNKYSNLNHRNHLPQFGNIDQTFARGPSGVYAAQAPYVERPPGFENQVRGSINGRAGAFERSAARRQSPRPMFDDNVAFPPMSRPGDNAGSLRVPRFDNDAGFPPTPKFGMYKRSGPERTANPQHHTYDGPPAVTNHYDRHSSHRKHDPSKLGMDPSKHQPQLSMQYDPFAPEYGVNAPGKGAAYTMFPEFAPPPHRPPPSRDGTNGRHVGVTIPVHSRGYQQQRTRGNTPFRGELQASGSIDLGRSDFGCKHAPPQDSLPDKSVDLAPQKIDVKAEATRYAQKPKYNLVLLADGLENYLNLMRSRTLHYTNIIASALPGIDNNILGNQLKHTELIITRVGQVYSRLKEVQGSGISVASLRLPGGLPPPIYHMLGLAVPQDALHSVDDVSQAPNLAQPFSKMSSNKVDDAWVAQSPKNSNASVNKWAAPQDGAAKDDWNNTPNGQANNDAGNWAEGNNDAGDWANSNNGAGDRPEGNNATDSWGHDKNKGHNDATLNWANSNNGAGDRPEGNNATGSWGHDNNKGDNDATLNWANNNQNENTDGAWPKDNSPVAQGPDRGPTSSHSKKSNIFGANANAPTDCNDANNANTEANIPSYFADWPRNDSFSFQPSKPSPRNAHIYPATPLPQVPATMQQQKTHAVQAGEGAQYEHLTRRPEYLDSMSQPYAVIRFKYRSIDALKKKFNTDQIEDVSAELTARKFDKLIKAEPDRRFTQIPRVTVETLSGLAKNGAKHNLRQSTLQGMPQMGNFDVATAVSAIDVGMTNCHGHDMGGHRHNTA